MIKVITNMLAFIHLVAAGEALMLAKQGGLDLAQSYHAIVASSGNSFVHETESQLVLNGSYDIGFTMDLALKDLGFALAMGEQISACRSSWHRASTRFSSRARQPMAAAPGRPRSSNCSKMPSAPTCARPVFRPSWKSDPSRKIKQFQLAWIDRRIQFRKT